MPGAFLADDLSVFLNPNEFGDVVTVNGQAMNAVVDVPSLETFDVETFALTITCKAVDVASVQRGQAAVVRSANYLVKSILPDGTGFVVLGLERP